MEFLRNKQKLIKIAKSKGLNLDEFLFNKYNNYKFKYLKSKKSMSGGKYKIGAKDSTPLLEANLSLVNAHGSIDIETWYALPENVYLMVTADIGGITCGNYNMIFNKLINDTNARDNLKTILETVSKDKIVGSADKIVRTIYEGGNIMYEPGDLIPKINLEYHNNSISGSAKVIYGIFNYKSIIHDDHTKIDILKEYDNLLRLGPEIVIERLNKFKIGTKINKNRLIKLIKKLKKKRVDFELAFNEFMVDDKYKKYISQPYNLDFSEIRDNEDNIFLTMIVSLFYKPDADVNTYSNSIKDIIDKLDKSKLNLIVLTSCLHTKNVLMRIFNNKTNIPDSLIHYNDRSGESQLAGEYFKNAELLPTYVHTKEEEDKVIEFLHLYKDWTANKENITYILEEEITHLSLNTHLVTILMDCIINNNHQVINLLRTNIHFSSKQLQDIGTRIVYSHEIEKTNDALIEFFKFKEFKNPNFKINYMLLYCVFERNNKKKLWDALIVNNIEWYSYDEYSSGSNISIIIKLITRYDELEIKDEDRLKLIKLFFTHSTFNLLNHILGNIYSIHDSVIENLDLFSSIIISNIDKNKIPQLLIQIRLSNLTIFNKIINILYSNKLLKNIKESDVTNLLINLIKDEYNINIDSLNNLIEKLKLLAININLPNEFGYNLYSYLVAKHTCSISRAKFEESKADSESSKEYIRREIIARETKQLEIIQKIEVLGFTNNGRIIKDIPLDFTGLDWDSYIDNVSCKNYIG